ncbi:MAG: biotin/lipoyl-binding protein [Thalassovita sp.]
MFDKILIANRGEIACRIAQTARSMGVKTVAVYSDADAHAAHVAAADQAVYIGGSAPADSYLRADRLIQAALDTGASAIHPGYGFLSENPDFVEAISDAGLTFIGPSAAAIRKMGLKDAAKALMQEAGVPVVPGYHGADQDPEFLARQAQDIGYPVLIKAVAGGGGKGMRLVEDPADFATSLQSARNEGQNAFGNPDVLIEKYIQHPRHIEVQVFGDGETAVHLFERDCSLQRRHQKVIEEAPAPGMTETMRQAMGQAATRAAIAIGYKGAGTIEFIVDGSEGLHPDRFWFMEMNTRLQVEHPVTEAITGVDLVEWQLRVAAGGPLPLTQEALSITGHSFEARLYAEDVPKGFLPATGTLTHLQFPAACRADSGVRSDDEISPFYDPMIAKIITHGPTRAVALARLRQALAETQVAGTVTNLAFLSALAEHGGFSAGQVDTGLIARDLDALTAEPLAKPQWVAQAAMVALDLMGAPTWDQGFSLWGSSWRDVTLLADADPLTLQLRVNHPTEIQVDVDGTIVTALYRDGWHFDGVRAREWRRDGDEITVFVNFGLQYQVPDPLDVQSSDAGDGNLIDAPMPGLVHQVFVTQGQAVREGERLVILEAMKMEHSLLAARDGVVAEVLTHQGDQVVAGAALILLEEAEA